MAKRFSSRMNRIGNLLVYNAERIIKEAALAGTVAAVENTSVKTGNARTNWRVSFETPNLALFDAPNTENRNVNKEVAGARALISAANVIKRWKMGESGSIIIANPVHYILDLDRGTSTQAPEGMSLFAIADAKDVLRKGRLLRGH